MLNEQIKAGIRSQRVLRGAMANRDDSFTNHSGSKMKIRPEGQATLELGDR